MTALLPCPFDGAPADKPRKNTNRHPNDGCWDIECSNCEAAVRGAWTEEAAIAAWNRRSPTTTDGGEVEAARLAIARIIEPVAPHILDGMLERAAPENHAQIIQNWFGSDVLGKADAILALPRATVETGWLIEECNSKTGEFKARWWGLGGEHEDGFGWTSDSLRALRFARQRDAQAYIDETGWTEAKPTEHAWSNPALALPRPIGGEGEQGLSSSRADIAAPSAPQTGCSTAHSSTGKEGA